MTEGRAIQTGPPKRLLSFDGGGVKGISSLMILKAIMDEVARIEDGRPTAYTPGSSKPTGDPAPKGDTSSSSSAGSDPNNERRPVDYFDLTGGTSTGGIIAVMMSRLEMTCSQAMVEYKSLASEIFAVRIFGFTISDKPILKWFDSIVLKIKLLFGTQYSAKYLDESIKKVVDKYIESIDQCVPNHQALLVNSRYNNYDAQGKMLMCATMADRGKALLFRDYTPPPDAIPETGLQNDEDTPAPKAPPYDQPTVQPADPSQLAKLLYAFNYNTVTIQEAVRATSAAPTYLPPEYIQNIQFWDGGLLNNNPIDQVWAARYDLAPDCWTEPYVEAVLSLGATYPTPGKPTTAEGFIDRLLGILSKTIGFASNVEAKHLDFKRNIYRRNLRQSKSQPTKYFRFNADVGKKAVDLADFKAMPFLEKKTQEYLDLPDTKKKVHAMASILARKDGVPHFEGGRSRERHGEEQQQQQRQNHYKQQLEV